MSKIKQLIIIIITALVTSFFLIESLGKTLNTQLYNYVNMESKRLVTNVITYSINEILEENLTEDLFTITKNTNNEIELLDYNTQEVNRILKIINQTIQKKLINLEEGNIEDFIISDSFKRGKFKAIKSGVICEIPLGTLKKNPLYSNFGPSIPIKMSFLGSINSNINTKITPYGFNSLVLEVSINVEIEEIITMPTSSKINKIKVTEPLTLKVIQGIIPEYYYLKGLEKGSFESKIENE